MFGVTSKKTLVTGTGEIATSERNGIRTLYIATHTETLSKHDGY